MVGGDVTLGGTTRTMGAGERSLDTAAASALAALRDDEIASTRLFLRIGWIVAAVACVGVLVLPGDPRLGHMLLVAIAATAGWSVLCYRTLHRPERPLLVSALAFACVACGTLANLYVGYFSAVPLVLALGVYFFCRIADRGEAITIYACTSISQLASSFLVIGGVIKDPAYAPVPAGIPPQAMFVGLFGIQLAYAIAFWLARSTRAATVHAIEELQRATRAAALRAVQLDELKSDLDRVLRVGGPGRYTNAVVGNWELGVVLGRGGIGEVYEAKHIETGAQAAVKLLKRELMIDRTHVERFLREVKAASALDSPHVVRVLDAVRPDDPVPFLAMERLRGDTLGGLLRGGKPLANTTIAEMIGQLAGALELARLAGVIHRDIKPNNLFRTEDGTWKLLDFGAAALGGATGTLTEGGVIGTPGYMAPEQAQGGDIDHRTDLYALAAVVYRCVTGRIPFAGGELAALMYAMVAQMPIKPSLLVHGVGRDVERFLVIGLAKRPADRFETPGELADALVAAFADKLSQRHREAADALAEKLPWKDDADTVPLEPER